jgi:hypothetical protein
MKCALGLQRGFVVQSHAGFREIREGKVQRRRLALEDFAIHHDLNGKMRWRTKKRIR